MATKTITIDKFSGIQPGGFHWCQGFLPNDKKLAQGAYITKRSQKGDTSLSNLALATGFCSRLLSTTNYVYAIDSAGYISRATTGAFTELRDISIAHCTHADIKAFTISGTEYLVYTTSEYLGRTADDSSFTDNYWDLGTATAGAYRQLEVWEDTLYIGNVTALATLASDGTQTASAKTLPTGYTFRCMSANGPYLLVGANKQGKGMICLWDGFSNGWNYLRPMDDQVLAVTPYERGWIFVCGVKLYFTDGFNIKLLATLPDAENSTAEITMEPNGLIVVKNKIILNGGFGAYTRAKTGCWIYDLETQSWSFASYASAASLKYSLYGGNGGAVFFDSVMEKIYVGYSTDSTVTANNYFIGYLGLYNDGTGSTDYSTFITPKIDLGVKALLKDCILELSPNYIQTTRSATPSLTVNLKVADSLETLWHYGQTNGASTNTTTLKVDGTATTYNLGSAGDEVLILDGQNGGLYRYILSVANNGTNTEIWTLDSVLNGNTENSVNFNITPFKNISTQTITTYTQNRLYFDIGGMIVNNACYLKFSIAQSYYSPVISKIILTYEEIPDPN